MTPHGEFHSIKAAARELNIRPNLIMYYCKIGVLQHAGTHITSNRTNQPLIDCRGWYIIND